MEGIGEGKVLSPQQQERMDAILAQIRERREALTAHLEEAEDPEERRAIEEELAKLPDVIVSMQTYSGCEVVK